MREKTKQDNTHVIVIIMLYMNRNSLIFKVLCVVAYLYIKNISVLKNKPKLSPSHIGFEDNSFDELSGIGIPKIY